MMLLTISLSYFTAPIFNTKIPQPNYISNDWVEQERQINRLGEQRHYLEFLKLPQEVIMVMLW
jgi:hypothetical protein